MEKEKKDLAELLAKGQTVEIYPQGNSMYPLVIPGRDRVVLAPFVRQRDRIRRGDVLLFRRENSILVLHRVCRVTQEGVYFVGDNQRVVEGPIAPSQILGRSVGFVRRGHRISIHHPLYVIFTGAWLLFLPLRPTAWKLLAAIRRILGRGRK